jgi:hypothetical protein
MTELPVVVIGAGPVGLAAAAHLSERNLPYLVLEYGAGPGAAISEWGQVRLFSPWRYNVDTAARRLLDTTGWAAPDPAVLPTGAELVEQYLQPLATALGGAVRYSARVVAVSRLGYDRVRTAGREQAPLLVRLADGTDLSARAVIDASGTWQTPNVLGASGIPAVGEIAAARFVDAALPDVLGADRDRFAGRHTLVVGAGHSAANTILALADLARDVPETTVTWAIRAGNPTRAYGGGDADALPARGALGSLLRDHVDAGRVRLLTGFHLHTLTVDGRRAAERHRGPDRRRDRVPPRPRPHHRTATGPGPRTRRHPRPRAAHRPERTLLRHRATARRGRTRPPGARLLRRRGEVVRAGADVPARHRVRAGPFRRRRPGRGLGRGQGRTAGPAGDRGVFQQSGLRRRPDLRWLLR